MSDDERGKPAYLSKRWQGRGKPRLLLVDDDAVMRRSSARFLARAGFEVISISSSREALESLERVNDFDAAVIDLEMPEMDGVELMRRIFALHPRLPMGLWSASERLDTLTSAELAPARFVKHKMRPIGELVQAVCEAIYSARLAASAAPASNGANGESKGSNGHGGSNGHQTRSRVARRAPLAAVSSL